MNGLILYTTEDGPSQIKLRAKDQTEHPAGGLQKRTGAFFAASRLNWQVLS